MYFSVFFLLQAWEVLHSRYAGRKNPFLRFAFSPPAWTMPWAMIALSALFAMQLITTAFIAEHQSASPCWQHLPIPVVNDIQESGSGPAQFAPSFALAAIAIMQSAFLLLLQGAQRNAPNPALRLFSWFTFASMLLEAIFAPVMTSSDAYYYLAYAKLGFSSYEGHAQPLPAHFSPFTDWCIHTVLPSAYGPAFILYLHAVLGLAHTPIAQILTLRAMNALWLLALLALLRRLDVSSQIILSAALNPVLLFQYIVNPHNDIIGVTLTLLAMATMTFSPLLAVASVIGAASIKLSFALIGTLVFTNTAVLWKRFGAAAATFVLSIACSYFFAGPAYFAGIAYDAKIFATSTNPLQYLVASIAVFAVVWALLRKRYGFTGLYALPSLRLQALFPWYLIWSLPYALGDKKLLLTFFILMPFTSILTDTTIPQSVKFLPYFFLCITVLVAICVDVSAVKNPPKEESA